MFDKFQTPKGKLLGVGHLTVRKFLLSVRAQGKKNQKKKENNCTGTILHVKPDGKVIKDVIV